MNWNMNHRPRTGNRRVTRISEDIWAAQIYSSALGRFVTFAWFTDEEQARDYLKTF